MLAALAASLAVLGTVTPVIGHPLQLATSDDARLSKTMLHSGCGRGNPGWLICGPAKDPQTLDCESRTAFLKAGHGETPEMKFIAPSFHMGHRLPNMVGDAVSAPFAR